MITGIGIDLIENARIRDSLDRFGDRFLSRIYTEAEKEYCNKCANPVIHYAARFAAKEAAFKALGTGWRNGVRWLDVEVTNLPSGKPELRLEGQALEAGRRLSVSRASLSISHTDRYAIAQVIFESD